MMVMLHKTLSNKQCNHVGYCEMNWVLQLRIPGMIIPFDEEMNHVLALADVRLTQKTRHFVVVFTLR